MSSTLMGKHGLAVSQETLVFVPPGHTQSVITYYQARDDQKETLVFKH